MNQIIIDGFDTDINIPQIVKKLRIEKGGKVLLDRFNELIEEVCQIARPKGAYKAVDFDVEGDNKVVIDGIHLTSRVLAVQLKDLHRVFPFVATCGREISEWAMGDKNMLERFWLETILDELLLSAVTKTGEHMVSTFGLGKTAVMTPGSIEDWALKEQKPLFSIIGDIEKNIGVRLLDSFMMDPRQSISGILFPTEIDFQTCMLCERQKCPKRRAAYDPELYERRFQKKTAKTT